MTSRDFAYWLQGFLEIRGEDGPLTAAQVGIVQRHLAMVFVHEIDPSMGGPKEQSKLDAIHRPVLTGGGPTFRC